MTHFDSDTSNKIREAKELMAKAKQLLVEAQSTHDWDNLKTIYQDKVYKAIQDLRDLKEML